MSNVISRAEETVLKLVERVPDLNERRVLLLGADRELNPVTERYVGLLRRGFDVHAPLFANRGEMIKSLIQLGVPDEEIVRLNDEAHAAEVMSLQSKTARRVIALVVNDGEIDPELFHRQILPLKQNETGLVKVIFENPLPDSSPYAVYNNVKLSGGVTILHSASPENPTLTIAAPPERLAIEPPRKGDNNE